MVKNILQKVLFSRQLLLFLSPPPPFFSSKQIIFLSSRLHPLFLYETLNPLHFQRLHLSNCRSKLQQSSPAFLSSFTALLLHALCTVCSLLGPIMLFVLLFRKSHPNFNNLHIKIFMYIFLELVRFAVKLTVFMLKLNSIF